MFRTKKRKEVKTRGQLLRAELNETVDHAMRAAGHAAGGVNAAVRPKVDAARQTMAPRMREAANRGWGTTVAVFTPMTEAAQAQVDSRSKDPKRKVRHARRQAKKVSRRRWPALVGLLAGGAAVGAVGAMLLRRRRQWEDIQASQSLEPAGSTATPAGSTATPAAGGESPPADPAEPPAEQVSATSNNRRS